MLDKGDVPFMNNYEKAEKFFLHLKQIWPLDLSQKINECLQGTTCILYYLSENNDCLSGDIASTLHMSTPRVSAAINSLQKKGYVTRRDDKKDARKTIVSLTEAGKTFLQEKYEKIISFLSYLIDLVGEEEMEHFNQTIEKIHTSMEQLRKKEEVSC